MDVARQERDRPRRSATLTTRDLEQHVADLEERVAERRPVLEVDGLTQLLRQERRRTAPRPLGRGLVERLEHVQALGHEERQRGADEQVLDVAAQLVIEPAQFVRVEHRAVIGT